MVEHEVKIAHEGTTLYMHNISKTFGGQKALDEVNLTIMPGEIHGLLGQNGCGKSTLIKILAGFHHPDKGGKLWINGKAVRLPLQPGEFNKYGMSFVHQDLGLMPTLTALENLRLSKLAISQSFAVNWNHERRLVKKMLHKYHVNININAVVSSLSQVEKAMLAIVRAVEDIKSNQAVANSKRGLLILDEPTVFLPKAEVDTLFSLVREVASEGISVLFVSHDLDEVMALTDRLTVLRDGHNCGSVVTAATDKDSVIEMILGQKLCAYNIRNEKSKAADDKTDAVTVSNLSSALLQSVSFSVKTGEVLGLTGLVGSGFEEVPYVMFGAAEEESGKIELDDNIIDLVHFNPNKAVEYNIALIPADRPNDGGIGDLRVEENMMMQVMGKYNPFKLKKKEMLEKSFDLLSRYEIHPDDPLMGFSQLSGGNQQKVVLAKWLQNHPKVLILHEPTQGVDIGARQQVYRHIARAAGSGTAVICSSSDYEQLEQICDRVLIFARGRIVSELVGSEIMKERITQLCYECVSA